ncbi:MerR family transcriptional regulator [Natronosporangium hydrolyticum]|uniref:MerR family transcriptional regulator n=1 Tax=Natronosporangium hydrolyticum TaxID=2811111 RepID=A0A895Y7B3_9ACTN|nr:MerR family transcriptional regulator [Natronosporangium hydrolyticum]QSB13251.1 MerR family transcriptional regulator [Natronosporangium hydrolyticum]
MNDRTELLTIGQLARRTGVPVRTIRFWSDSGIVPPAARSPSGYRLYDPTAVARLDLTRTLRELGLDLDTVSRVLARQVSVADVARLHAEALDAEIRTLRLRRAVLRSVAERADNPEEMRIVHQLARLNAQERQRLIDDFVAHAFEGIDPDAPGATIAQGLRTLPAELPDEPTTEQVNAWVELAELIGDESFRHRVRQMAVTGAQTVPEQQPFDIEMVKQHAGEAVAAGLAPDAAEARGVLERIIDPELPADERLRLAERTETFTDERVERYWRLLGILNGWPAFTPVVPAFDWFIAALRAHAR